MFLGNGRREEVVKAVSKATCTPRRVCSGSSGAKDSLCEEGVLVEEVAIWPGLDSDLETRGKVLRSQHAVFPRLASQTHQPLILSQSWGPSRPHVGMSKTRPTATGS